MGTARLAGQLVPRVGYGAMQLAERDPRPSRESARMVLRTAIELGVRHIDTAPFYGHGLADELIRDALHPYPDDLVIATKVGARRDADGKLVAAQRPEELREAVETCASGLGVEQIPVVNLRRLDAAPGIVATGDQIVDLDDQLAELAALRDAGTVGAIGLSQVDEPKLRRALPLGIACVQNSYNLLERGEEPMLHLCGEHDIRWVPYFPLGSAFPGRPKVTDHPDVRTVATRLGATPAQVGLAWLLAHDPGILLIPGTASVEHLIDNVTSGELALTPDDSALLDRAA